MWKPVCDRYLRRLVEAVSEAASRCNYTILSGGIDTSFIVASHPHRSMLKAITVDLGGVDLKYAREAAEKLGIERLYVVKPSMSVFIQAVDWVLRELKTIDPVEVAADAVHYISMSKCLELGGRCIISGDGGDELFLGYDFLLDEETDKLRGWIEAMVKGAWLPTVWVGRKLGLDVITPLYSDRVKKLVLEVPLDCLIDRGRRYGKLILRRHLDSLGLKTIAWRAKTAVTTGSGSRDVLMKLADKVEDSWLSEVEEALGFKPPTAIHTYLAYRIVKLGIKPPPKCGDGSKRCPVCGRCLKGRYCRFCGAVISEDGRAMLHGAS